MERPFCIYILTSNNSSVLYVGMTSDLKDRIFQHKEGFADGFTKRYRVHKLVYYELAESFDSALFREKQIKNYSRTKKMELITSVNPHWDDLYEKIQD